MSGVVLRTSLKPGDVGMILHLHGVIHAELCGFGPTFEAEVAGALAEFVKAPSPRGRLWVAERDGRVVGCVAIVERDRETAQLRWFLVVPEERGAGLGRRLLDEGLAFCREQGYGSVILWTVGGLEAAERLYRSAGFTKVQEKAGRMGGVDVAEQRYSLRLG